MGQRWKAPYGMRGGMMIEYRNPTWIQKNKLNLLWGSSVWWNYIPRVYNPWLFIFNHFVVTQINWIYTTPPRFRTRRSWFSVCNAKKDDIKYNTKVIILNWHIHLVVKNNQPLGPSLQTTSSNKHLKADYSCVIVYTLCVSNAYLLTLKRVKHE